MKLKFGKYFGAEAWLRFWSLILVKILKLGLVHILNFKFYSQNPELVEILKLSYFGKLNSTLGYVVPLAMF